MAEVAPDEDDGVFEYVSAYRTDEPDPVIADNVMALVLPKPMSKTAIYQAIARMPKKRPPGFESLPLEVRQERPQRIEQFFHVQESHFPNTNRLIRFARNGMSARNPKDPKVQRAIMLAASGRDADLGRTGLGGGGGLGLVILGPSGSGKSAFLDLMEDFFGKRVRVHQMLNGRPCRWCQLPIVRVNVKSTFKETLIDILGVIDEKYGRSHLKPTYKGSTISEIKRAVLTALCSGFATMLVLDEFQRLRDFKKEQAKTILEGLIDFMESGGVPVVLVGTAVMEAVFDLYPHEMAKFTNGGFMHFKRLAIGSQESQDYVKLLQYQYASIRKIDYCENFVEILLAFAGRIHRFVKEYMKIVLLRHSEDENIVVDSSLLVDISQNEMKLFEQALSQIRLADLGIRPELASYDRYEHYLHDAEKNASTTQGSAELESELRTKSMMGGRNGKISISAKEFVALDARRKSPVRHNPQENVSPFPQARRDGETRPVVGSPAGQPRTFKGAKGRANEKQPSLQKPGKRARAPELPRRGTKDAPDVEYTPPSRPGRSE